MTSIIEFLEARNLEDEAIALGALHHPSKYNGDTLDFDRTGTDPGEWHTDSYVDPNDKRMVTGAGITIYDEGGHTAGQAEHIARHDPARILREVAAKRAIVGWWAEMVDWNDKGRIQHERTGEWCRLPILPPVLERLASAYADHPDYNPEWAL